MKLNCFIDTCTCINLSNTEFKQKKLLYYLNISANLNYSKEVYLELRDHRAKNLPNFIFNESRKILTKKFSINEYERRMVGQVLISRGKNKNKGEIDNFLTSIDQIHHFGKNNLVFITDDFKAINFLGGQDDWLKSFPALTIWTSYDVILYLYAEKIIPSKDIANELIQDIITFTSPPVNHRSEKTTSERLKLKVVYHKRIENISKLLK